MCCACSVVVGRLSTTRHPFRTDGILGGDLEKSAKRYVVTFVCTRGSLRCEVTLLYSLVKIVNKTIECWIITVHQLTRLRNGSPPFFRSNVSLGTLQVRSVSKGVLIPIPG